MNETFAHVKCCAGEPRWSYLSIFLQVSKYWIFLERFLIIFFSYRAANSAHGEEWHMRIRKENSEDFICTIEDIDRQPPHATYEDVISVHICSIVLM